MTAEITPAKVRFSDGLGRGAEAPPLLGRLRQRWPDTPHHRDGLHREAADEIERLRTALKAATDRGMVDERVSYRGYSYGMRSMSGIADLRRAIEQDGKA